VIPLHDEWHLESACKVTSDGAALSATGFEDKGWLTTAVPSTVLAAQVTAGIFPDPFFGMNLRSIPGTTYPLNRNFMRTAMSADSPYRCAWWYRKEFATPAVSNGQRHVFLYFEGVNYRANIWLNGHRLADSNAVAGTYRTYEFDVTDELAKDKPNVLAVEVFAPQEHDLGVNWMDQAPFPPDKNMGLQGRVDVRVSGPVTVRSPMVATHFSDDSLSTAELTVYAEVSNATDRTVSGVASGVVAGIHFSQSVTLAPRENHTVVFSPSAFPQLRLHNPKPWWPRQMGEPHLEQLQVSFAIGGQLSDEQNAKFGIREITSELTAVNGGRLFLINGKRLLIRGGAWTQDLLLRQDEKRLRDQFDLVSNLNLNTIRLEGKLEPEEFFRLADEHGILVMAGWACCQNWENWEDWKPEDLKIATESLHSQMLRFRSHASMLVWLNGSDHAPPLNVESAYLKVESETHWPNPILASASTRFGQEGPTGFKMNGPYDYVPPSYWYVDKQYGGAFGFNTETGPGEDIPSLASRKNFLPDPNVWPTDQMWNYHNGGGKFATLQIFDNALAAIYGKPNSSAEYVRIAETMAYDSQRAMFEAFNKNKYLASGVIQHMLNNAWPSTIWHLYDYYLNADAGYFGTQRACEPLHIQYAYDDHSIVVVNSTYQSALRLHASVQVHNMAWKELFTAENSVDSSPDSSQQISVVPPQLYSALDKILFVDLTLKDSSGLIVSRNSYWVPTTSTQFDWPMSGPHGTPAIHFEDLTDLRNLPPSKVIAHAESQQTSSGHVLKVHLENPTSALAFQIHLAIQTSTGENIAPALWSDNWIELVPGESRELIARLPANSPPSQLLQIAGWNIISETITLK
jgi:exo-1,4-beta-D-glucosaminidase